METISDTVRSTQPLFVTYARQDRELVLGLRSGLQRLRHDVWLDDRLRVGQTWWNEILGQIQRCEAMVVAVSPALLESKASAAERGYAIQLGKVLLPVCLRPINNELLPPDLAPLQLVDYCNPGPEAAFELADALASLPRSPKLPDPLPQPPTIPVSYMASLSAQVRAPSLTLDEQLVLVSKLRASLAKETQREPALELLGVLANREDLYHATGREIETVLATQNGIDAGPPEQERSTSQRPAEQPEHPHIVVPADWYPDPSNRHELRWFDNDWTDWACDGSVVIQDPL